MPVTQGHGNPDWSREETILALDVVLRHYPRLPSKDSDEVRALSQTLGSLPIHSVNLRTDRFRNSAGVYMKIQNLMSLHPDRAKYRGLKTSKTDRAVWDEYADTPDLVAHLATEIVKGAEVLAHSATDDEPDALAVTEGALLVRVHRVRERAKGLRSRVLKRVQDSFGRLACETCGWRPDDGSAAAEVVAAALEVHHLVPLSQAASAKTRLADVALLCANCHRLIHAAIKVNNQTMTLAEFREWLKT